MSKAFTREDDAQEGEELIARSSHPAGVKNYMTPEGVTRLREELALLEKKRHELMVVDDEALEGQRRRLEARAREITDSLATAEVVSAPDSTGGDICFGAFVTVRDRSGTQSEYRIVGIDEADFEKGEISWLSPLARVLINKRAGQRVELKTLEGENQLEVVSVRYESPPAGKGASSGSAGKRSLGDS